MRSIFLAPHLDDAALSCGGTIYQLGRAGGEVVVITAMAGKPGLHALSDLARRLHKLMGGAEQVVGGRRAEDAAAMDILGARRELLPYLDALYRPAKPGSWRYPTMSSLFAPVHADDRELIGDIADAIVARTDPASDRYHAPLGVGGHVDHRLVNAVGHELARHGAKVWFYEDYPYAEPDYRHVGTHAQPVALDGVLATSRHRHLVSEIQPLSAADIEARIASICAYESQLPMLFGDRVAVTARVAAFAGSRGTDGPAERFWRPSRLAMPNRWT